MAAGSRKLRFAKVTNHTFPGAALTVRALLAIALGVLAAWAVPSASAATPVLNQKVVTPNFVVHYTTAAGGPDAITDATAQAVGANAEQALAAEEQAFGFDPPLSGPDAHVDIYVYEIHTANEGIVGPRFPDADQSESYILQRASKATDRSIIAHEMFHVLQDSVWVLGGKFLDEATATWAQARAFPKEGSSTDLDPGVPLDCVDEEACPSAGYQSWSFFEFLAERYGAHIVREIYEQAKALRVNRGGAAPIAAVSAAVAAHGATLGRSFRDFALANINGDYTLEELKGGGVSGLIDTTPLRTGVKARKLGRRRFTVKHLATTYLPVVGGGHKTKAKCGRARLRLDISGPRADGFAGYALGEGKPKPIALTNGRGRLTLRSWRTCSKADLTLALVNAGTSGARRSFTVSGTLTVP
jgi:Family of unknown function (DUF6055)